MDALPVELLALIAEWTDSPSRPALGAVNRVWALALVYRRRTIGPPWDDLKRRVQQSQEPLRSFDVHPHAIDWRRHLHSKRLQRPMSQKYMRRLLKANYEGLVRWAHETLGMPLPNNALVLAVRRSNDPQWIEWLYRRTPRNAVYACESVYVACRRGHLRVIQWYFANSTNPCAHAGRCTMLAAKGGHLDVVEWLSNQLEKNAWAVREGAFKGGHVHVLEWLRANGVPRIDPTSEDINAAAKRGHLSFLEWTHNTCGPWGVTAHYACLKAANSKHWDTLRWLRGNGFRCDDRLCEPAVLSGCIDLLDWTLAQGVWWNPLLAPLVAQSGDLAMLQWLVQHGHRLDGEMARAAASSGHLPVLEWVCACGFDLKATTFSDAAEHGEIDMLRWLLANRCPWDATVCAAAAARGRLDILQWLRHHGCPWDAETCTQAATWDHLDVLEWARANGCPWDARTMFVAARCGHVEVAQWLYERECPWKERMRDWPCDPQRSIDVMTRQYDALLYAERTGTTHAEPLLCFDGPIWC